MTARRVVLTIVIVAFVVIAVYLTVVGNSLTPA